MRIISEVKLMRYFYIFCMICKEVCIRLNEYGIEVLFFCMVMYNCIEEV